MSGTDEQDLALFKIYQAMNIVSKASDASDFFNTTNLEGNHVKLEAIKELRKIFLASTSYASNNEQEIEMSFQQLFYKLYKEYESDKQKLENAQIDKQRELLDRYPGDCVDACLNREEEYLVWNQMIAEAYQLKINATYGKLINLFTESDLKLIEQILEDEIVV